MRLPRLIGHGRALDLILTGREVGATEALDIGLVNRLVPAAATPGEAALEAAQALARQIASFPQACMRADRKSVYEQESLALDDALVREFRSGTHPGILEEALAGAGSFAGGAGRHGAAASKL